MKKFVYLLLITLLAFNVNGQQKMGEKDAIRESHIDFTRQYLFFTLHGMIEIDGHTFLNDTCRCPIIYQANLDGITIVDTCMNIIYEHRTCSIKGCKTIHLIIKENVNVFYPQWDEQWFEDVPRYFYIPCEDNMMDSIQIYY